MYKQYYYPLQIFIILEKVPAIIWTSQILNVNHYISFISSKWFYALNYIIRHELLLSSTLLIEVTAIDTLHYNIFNKKLNIFFKKNRLLMVYIYYNLLMKIRLTFLVFNMNFKKMHIASLDLLFKNSNWIERETSEMYGILYYWKVDTRKLLLEYSSIHNPLLKDFPSEGLQEVFYNFFENQITVNQNELIEL